MKFWPRYSPPETDYILGEIVPETREQDTTENSNRRETDAAM